MDYDTFDSSTCMQNHTVSELSPMRSNYLTFYKSRRDLSGKRMVQSPAYFDQRNLEEKGFQRKCSGSHVPRLIPKMSGSDLCIDDNVRKHASRGMLTSGLLESAHEGRSLDYFCNEIESGKSIISSHGLTSCAANDTLFEPKHYASFRKGHTHGQSSADIWNKSASNYPIPTTLGADTEADYKSSTHFDKIFGERPGIGELSGINTRMSSRKLFYVQEYQNKMNSYEGMQDPSDTAVCNKRQSYIDKTRNVFEFNHKTLSKNHSNCPDECCGKCDLVPRSAHRSQCPIVEPDHEVYASYINDHCRKNRRGRSSNKLSDPHGRFDIDRNIRFQDFDAVSAEKNKPIRHYISYDASDLSEISIASRYGCRNENTDRRYDKNDIPYFANLQEPESVSNFRSDNKVARDRNTREDTVGVMEKSKKRRRCESDDSHDLRGVFHSNSHKNSFPSKRRSSKRRQRSAIKDDPCYIQNTYNKAHINSAGRKRSKHRRSPTSERQEHALNLPEEQPNEHRSLYSAPIKSVLPDTPTTLIDEDILLRPPWTCTKWATDVFKNSIEEPSASQWAYEVYSDTCLLAPTEDLATDGSNKSCPETNRNFRDQETAGTNLEEVSQDSSDCWKRILCTNNFATNALKYPKNVMGCETEMATMEEFSVKPYLVAYRHPINIGQLEQEIDHDVNEMWPHHGESVSARCENIREEIHQEIDKLHNCQINCGALPNKTLGTAVAHQSGDGNTCREIEAIGATSKLSQQVTSNSSSEKKFVIDQQYKSGPGSQRLDITSSKNTKSSESTIMQAGSQCSIDDRLINSVHAIKEDIQSVFDRLSSLDMHEDRGVLNTAISLKDSVLCVLDQATAASENNSVTDVNSAAEVLKNTIKQLVEFRTAYSTKSTDDETYNKLSYDLYKNGKDEYNSTVDADGCHRDITVYPIDAIRLGKTTLPNVSKLGRIEANKVASRSSSREHFQQRNITNELLVKDNEDERIYMGRRNSPPQRHQLDHVDHGIDHGDDYELITKASQRQAKLAKPKLSEKSSSTDLAKSEVSSAMFCMQKQQEKLPYDIHSKPSETTTEILQTVVSSPLHKMNQKREGSPGEKYVNALKLLDYSRILDSRLTEEVAKFGPRKPKKKTALISDLTTSALHFDSNEQQATAHNSSNVNGKLAIEDFNTIYCNMETRNAAFKTSENSPETSTINSIESPFSSSGITNHSSISVTPPTFVENIRYSNGSDNDENGDEDTNRSSASRKQLVKKKFGKRRRRSNQEPTTVEDFNIVYKIKSRTSVSKSKSSISKTVIFCETEDKEAFIPSSLDINQVLSDTQILPDLKCVASDSTNCPERAFSVCSSKREECINDIITANCPNAQVQIMSASAAITPGSDVRKHLDISQQNRVITPEPKRNKSRSPSTKSRSPSTKSRSPSTKSRSPSTKSISSNINNDSFITFMKADSLQKSSSETSRNSKSGGRVKRRKGVKKLRKANLQNTDPKQNAMILRNAAKGDASTDADSKACSSKNSVKKKQKSKGKSMHKHTPTILQSPGEDIAYKPSADEDLGVLSIDSYERAIGTHADNNRNVLVTMKQIQKTVSGEKAQEDKDILDGVSATQLNLSILKLYDEINKLRLKLEASKSDRSSHSSPTTGKPRSYVKLTVGKRRHMKKVNSIKTISLASSSSTRSSSSGVSILTSTEQDTDSSRVKYYDNSKSAKKVSGKRRERHRYTELTTTPKYPKHSKERNCCSYRKYGCILSDSQQSYFPANEEVDMNPASYVELPDNSALHENVEYFDKTEHPIVSNLDEGNEEHLEQEVDKYLEWKQEGEKENGGTEYWSEYKILDAIHRGFYDGENPENGNIHDVDTDQLGVVASLDRRHDAQQSVLNEFSILSEAQVLYTSNILPAVNLEFTQKTLQARSSSSPSCNEKTVSNPSKGTTSQGLFKCKMEPSEPDVWPHSFVYNRDELISKTDSIYKTSLMRNDNCQTNEIRALNNCTRDVDCKGEYNPERSNYSGLLKNSIFDNFLESDNKERSEVNQNDIYFVLNSKLKPNSVELSWSNRHTGSPNDKTHASYTEGNGQQSPSDRPFPDKMCFKRTGTHLWTDAEESPVRKEEDYIPQSHVPRIVQCVKDMLFGSTKAQAKDTPFENSLIHACPATPIGSSRKKFSNSPTMKKSDIWTHISNDDGNDISTKSYVNARRRSRSNTKLQDDETDAVSSPMLRNYIFKKKDVIEMSRSHSSIDDSENTSKIGSVFEEEINEKSPSYSEDLWIGNEVSNYNLRGANVVLTSQTSQRQQSLKPDSSPCYSALKSVEETDKVVRHYCDAISASGSKRLPAHEMCHVSVSTVSNSSDTRSENSFTNSFGMEREYFKKQDEMSRHFNHDKSPNLLKTGFHEEIEQSRSPIRARDRHCECKNNMDAFQGSNPSTSANILITSVENIMQQRRSCYVEHCGFRQKKLDNILIGSCGAGDTNNNDTKMDNTGHRLLPKTESVCNTFSDDNNSSNENKRAKASNDHHESSGMAASASEYGNRKDLFSKKDQLDTAKFIGDMHMLNNKSISEKVPYSSYSSRSASGETTDERKDERSFAEVTNNRNEDIVEETVGEDYDDRKKAISEDDDTIENFSDDDSTEPEMSGNTSLDDDENEEWYNTTDDESNI